MIVLCSEKKQEVLHAFLWKWSALLHARPTFAIFYTNTNTQIHKHNYRHLSELIRLGESKFQPTQIHKNTNTSIHKNTNKQKQKTQIQKFTNTNNCHLAKLIRLLRAGVSKSPPTVKQPKTRPWWWIGHFQIDDEDQDDHDDDDESQAAKNKVMTMAMTLMTMLTKLTMMTMVTMMTIDNDENDDD